MEILPIGSLRNEAGALVALVDALGSDEAAMPVPLEDPGVALANFHIVSDSLSISVAATLGIGTIFKGQIAANEQAFYFDAMAFTDRFVADSAPAPAGQVLGTRWGVGLRILLRVQKFDTSATLNFGVVGAAVELGAARATYEVQGLGLGGAFSQILGSMSGTGTFTYATYLQINGPIQQKVATFIDEHRDQLIPQPIGVAISRSLDPIKTARAVYFAMNGLAGRLPLEDLMKALPIDADRGTAERTYAEIQPGIGPNDRPSEDSQRHARSWLNR